VGRTDELASIDRMLDEPDCRLLTLVGPGGVGKTRLALEAAARRIDRYQHGVHFVPLVGVPAPDLFAPALAESLQFQVDNAHSAIPARDQLVDFLRERATLLVLDNFEHLLDARDVLSQVIEQAPQVELLTTSRERLQLQSEWVLDVDGLANGNGNGSAGGSAAVRLFVDRARQVDRGYALADDERPHVERVCRLVSGMPLGIELAAAWASTLPCSEIADDRGGLAFWSRRCTTSRSGTAASAPRSISRGGCSPTTNDVCSHASLYSVAPSREMPRPRCPEPVWVSSTRW
jgi:predicted ATPase